jgi:hypothetical protein
MVPCKLLLQALVGVVNAQLLKAVFGEGLKAIDVQNGDGQATATSSSVCAARCIHQCCAHTASFKNGTVNNDRNNGVTVTKL